MVLGQKAHSERSAEGQAHEGQGTGHESNEEGQSYEGQSTSHGSNEEVSSSMVKNCQLPNRSKTDDYDTISVPVHFQAGSLSIDLTGSVCCSGEVENPQSPIRSKTGGSDTS